MLSGAGMYCLIIHVIQLPREVHSYYQHYNDLHKNKRHMQFNLGKAGFKAAPHQLFSRIGQKAFVHANEKIKNVSNSECLSTINVFREECGSERYYATTSVWTQSALTTVNGQT
ncbi:hypothetical protein CEXT_141621 [Caerostris extrusa]|uniref:Uncharacterized protein n=1 Tax=Caerostris extrusa TaxID=172846 RepID=A0AAV4USC6_CAEEX|nr:hypothetical protein CEXT_141621 [Caerostris extrusa]